jgi:hypothetical protein
MQMTAVKLWGFSEFSLRLFPLLCSLASLFVFWRLASRLLTGVAWMAAVGVFAVGYPGLRYAVEAKPYGCDLFVAVWMFALLSSWWASGAVGDGARLPGGEDTRPLSGAGSARDDSVKDRRQRWLICLIASVPFAMLLSYPAVFVSGAISLVLAFVLWRERARRGWLLWVVYNVVLLVSFLAVYCLTIAPQSAAELANMSSQWEHTFPPLTSPWQLICFVVLAHTSELVAYPVGGPRGASLLTAICCGVALVVLWRRGHRWLVVLCLAPLALNFVAAAWQRYPYGGHVRFMLYMGPLVCLLAGLGMAVLLSRLTHRRVSRQIPVIGLAVLLAAIPCGSMVRDFLKPYKQLDYQRTRDFARWFWFTKALDGELVCVKTDLGKGFAPGTFEQGTSSLYLCNQRIYSRRHAQGEKPCWDHITRDRPLRCVLFRSPNFAFDEEAFDAWLEGLERDYAMVTFAWYSLPLHDHHTGQVWYSDRVEMYEFIPRSAADARFLAEPNPYRRVRALETR